MDEQFTPAYAATLGRDHVLSALGERTPVAALEAGIPPAQVWTAICDDLHIPEGQRLGVDRAPLPVPAHISAE